MIPELNGHSVAQDGEIMDMQRTIEALVEASHVSPLSVSTQRKARPSCAANASIILFQIVIIGVGPADFSSMVALDGDGGKLRASNGRVSARDM